MKKPKVTHKLAYDKGVWLRGWVIGDSPLDTSKVVFMTPEGDLFLSPKNAVLPV